MYGEGHLTLKSMMGKYPKTDLLKSGEIKSADFDFDFADVEVANTAFKRACNGLEFDVPELAIVTFLQAHAAGRPFLLLPYVMHGQFHHKSLVCRADDPSGPQDLKGKKVAMRSYTQTTPTWVRGILSDDFGVPTPSVTWVGNDEGHVSGYEEPEWSVRAKDKRPLDEVLLNGEVDAILASGMWNKPGFRAMIPNVDEAIKDWYARHKLVPINHMVAVRKELAAERPDLVKQVYNVLVEARETAGGGKTPDGIDMQPYGLDKVVPGIELVMRYAYEQALIPEIYPVESLFGDVLKALE